MTPGSAGAAGPARSAWLEVERFRHLGGRAVAVGSVVRPLLVLGSTQSADLVNGAAAADAGVDVARRRSGGGAVLVGPHDTVWMDAWVPHDDPLWQDDVGTAAAWVGEWWRRSLALVGITGTEVHRAGLRPGPFSDLVCFAGRGPGEVVAGGRKVVGVAQWRSRQGSLFHTAAYRRWDPALLCSLVGSDGAGHGGMVDELGPVAAGIDDLVAPGPPGAPAAWARLPGVLLAQLPGPATWRHLGHP